MRKQTEKAKFLNRADCNSALSFDKVKFKYSHVIMFFKFKMLLCSGWTEKWNLAVCQRHFVS